jgi:hypothetical protein
MHRRTWLTRLARRGADGWACERCEWKRFVAEHGDGVEFGDVLGVSYLWRRFAPGHRYRKLPRTTTFIDP